jgi:hypothetical protein
MSEVRVDTRSPAERVADLPRIQRALRAAVRDALMRHKQAGLPVVIWRDGAVVWIPPEEIVLQEDEASE